MNKPLTFLLLLIVTAPIHGQSQQVIDSLTEKISMMESELELLKEKDSIQQANQINSELNSNENNRRDITYITIAGLVIFFVLVISFFRYNRLKSRTNNKLLKLNNEIEQQNDELITAFESLKETQSQLLQSEKMASIGTLTAGVAHEINNPLNFISGGYIGLLDLIKNSDELKDNNDAKRFLDAINLGLSRSTAIVEGLSQFSSDRQSRCEDCNINEIIYNNTHRLK